MMGRCNLVCEYVGMSDNCVAQSVVGYIGLMGSSDPDPKRREAGSGSQEGWSVR